MRTRLEHLPESKRRELARAMEILFAEFERAVGGGPPESRRKGHILKVILFGSYARGDWVDDPAGGYASDYDLLVVVDDERYADLLDYWSGADARLLEAYQARRILSAPVNVIVHSLADLNARLKRGQYFFRDVIRDGIALFEAPGHPLDRPKKLPPAEALKEARAHFEYWLPSAVEFLDDFESNSAKGRNAKAAFELHQAAERLYHCLLLVLTLYSPKSHKLNFLRAQVERLVPSLAEAWPRASRFEQRCFELLRRAYVDARYSSEYRITAEELAWLGERVGRLRSDVAAACAARLEQLSVGADPD